MFSASAQLRISRPSRRFFRAALLAALLLCCLLLTGCRQRDPLAAIVSTATDITVPLPAPDAALPRQESVTLWFRLGTEALLAPETRTITLTPAAPYELTLLQALTGGPSASSLELNGLFPPGTKVLSTHLQGRTLFVTLSRQIMNDFADEPSAWASNAAWAAEVPLRRHLAMQAIAATVTENCDVDQVVILVEHTARSGDSLRLRQGYYRSGDADANALAAPLHRDESVLLTPGNTLAVILDCWQMQDWARLYPFISRTDAATGEVRPAYDAFAARMDALPPLTDYTASTGSVSQDGQSAVFSVRLSLLSNGQEYAAEGTLRLHREKGIWRISLSQFTGREGDLP
ncbi:MAG: GerMN domain-containing protein [Clostridia bacterium]|nr:GerMN domain-containing protein [Clostridia bacterium]